MIRLLNEDCGASRQNINPGPQTKNVIIQIIMSYFRTVESQPAYVKCNIFKSGPNQI